MKNLVNYLKKMIDIIKFSPTYSVLIIIFTILMGIVPSVGTVVLAELFNNIQAHTSKNTCVVYLILFCILTCIDLLMPSIFNYFEISFQNILRQKFAEKYFKKLCELPYHLVENKEVRNLIARINDRKEGYYECFSNLMQLGGLIVRLLSCFGVVAIYSFDSAAIILIAAYPIIRISYYFGNKNYKIRKKTIQNVRFINYLERIMQQKETLNERFVFRYTQKVINVWESMYENIRRQNTNLEFKRNLYSKIGGAFSYCLFGGIMFKLLKKVISGEILIGSFSAICQRLLTLISLLSTDATQIIYDLVNNQKYLDDLDKFWTLSVIDNIPDVNPLYKNTFEKLEFKHVYFRYPGTNKVILNNLSFIIEKNKTYAFVGGNSAGKSTIIKLLLGLYSNYEGTILINDCDIRTIPFSRLYSFFAVVFQDFSKYELTVKENIELSGNVSKDYSIGTILDRVGLRKKINELPEKENTFLGKLNRKSVELSGGEWQKLVIARCLANNAPIRILDEPTSALDPVYEKKFFEDFQALNVDKTLLLISHRLGSTRLADTILVLKDGHIIEQGNFESLMSMKGEYYEMFNEQRKWYI